MEISILQICGMEISFYNHWLDSGQKYAEGVEFYIKHGSNNTLKRLFASGENSFTKDKLDEELYKLNHIPYVVKKPYNRVKPKINREKLPPYLQTEYDKLTDLIGIMSYKHAQLEIVRYEEERFMLAADILAAATQRRAIFTRIDHFLETGEDLKAIAVVKPPAKEKELLVLQLRDELLRLRSQRSKLKKNLKRIEDYNKVLTRIAEIERRIADAI